MNKNLVICPDNDYEQGQSNSVKKITLVKKIKVDGKLCSKSARVFTQLQQLGLLEHIDQILLADERQPSSIGFDLAIKHGVKSAPFFIVDHQDGSTEIYTMYYRFLNEILGHHSSEQETVNEIMAHYQDVDFI